MAQTSSKKPKRRADQYNDPKHNYLKYWDGREYEHAAEEIAIRKLLKDKPRFNTAVDVGGGYGRLCLLLEEYADKVTLAEPSQQQLDIAKDRRERVAQLVGGDRNEHRFHLVQPA